MSEILAIGLMFIIGMLVFMSGLFTGMLIENRRYIAKLGDLQTDYRLLEDEWREFRKQMWAAMQANKRFTQHTDSAPACAPEA